MDGKFFNVSIFQMHVSIGKCTLNLYELDVGVKKVPIHTLVVTLF